MHPRALQVATPSDTTILLTRTFNAPRKLVWEAMFTPDKMRRWMMAPPGWTATTYECTPVVGGYVSVEFKSDDADPAMTLRGVFTDVVPHERIVHTEIMALGNGQIVGSLVEKHEFSEESGVTMMRITQTYESREARDGAVADMGAGLEACYKQLDALID